MAREETTLRIIGQSVQGAATATTAGGIPTPGAGVGGMPSPTDRGGVFKVFQESLGDSLRDFASNLTASVTATLSGALVGRATGSFTAAGAVSTIVGQTVRTIQTRAAKDKAFGELSPEEQLISAREEVEGRKLNPLETLLARGAAAKDPGIGRKEAQAAGLIQKEAIGAAGAAAKILPVLGGVLAAGLIMSETFKAVNKGLKTLQDSLAPFSGEIQEAEANIQIRAIEGKIRRAEEFGPALARLAESRGRFEESFEDFKAKILTTLLPLIQTIFELGSDILDKIPGVGTEDPVGDFVGEVLSQLVARQGVQAPLPEQFKVGRGQ